ncbi:MAG: putative signal transducing protein [bacterium]
MEGIEVCGDCGIPLIPLEEYERREAEEREEMERRSRDPDLDMVTVLKTADESAIAVAKSILEGEGIDYHIKGENFATLYNIGKLAEREIMVRKKDAQKAKESISGLGGFQ